MPGELVSMETQGMRQRLGDHTFEGRRYQFCVDMHGRIIIDAPRPIYRYWGIHCDDLIRMAIEAGLLGQDAQAVPS